MAIDEQSASSLPRLLVDRKSVYQNALSARVPLYEAVSIQTVTAKHTGGAYFDARELVRN